MNPKTGKIRSINRHAPENLKSQFLQCISSWWALGSWLIGYVKNQPELNSKPTWKCLDRSVTCLKSDRSKKTCSWNPRSMIPQRRFTQNMHPRLANKTLESSLLVVLFTIIRCSEFVGCWVMSWETSSKLKILLYFLRNSSNSIWVQPIELGTLFGAQDIAFRSEANGMGCAWDCATVYFSHNNALQSSILRAIVLFCALQFRVKASSGTACDICRCIGSWDRSTGGFRGSSMPWKDNGRGFRFPEINWFSFHWVLILSLRPTSSPCSWKNMG